MKERASECLDTRRGTSSGRTSPLGGKSGITFFSKWSLEESGLHWEEWAWGEKLIPIRPFPFCRKPPLRHPELQGKQNSQWKRTICPVLTANATRALTSSIPYPPLLLHLLTEGLLTFFTRFSVLMHSSVWDWTSSSPTFLTFLSFCLLCCKMRSLLHPSGLRLKFQGMGNGWWRQRVPRFFGVHVSFCP